MLKVNNVRKVSIALVLSLLLSISLPVLAYAASLITIVYNSATGEISGVIYSDQSWVSLSADTNGTTTDITNSVVSQTYRASNGTYFYKVQGNIGTGLDLRQLKVTDDQDTYTAPVVTSSVYSFNTNTVPGASLTPSIYFVQVNGKWTANVYWQAVYGFDIEKYNVYLDGVKIKETKKHFAIIKDLLPLSMHELSISAVDLSGQESSPNHYKFRVNSQFNNEDLFINNKPSGYKLKANDSIVKFQTPSDFNESLSQGAPKETYLTLTLPFAIKDEPTQNYKFYYNTAIKSNALDESDFSLVDSNGDRLPIKSIYISSSPSYPSWVFLTIDGDLQNDASYTLKMSPTSSGDEITLPEVNTGHGSFGLNLETNYSHYSNDVTINTENLLIGDPIPPAKPMNFQVTAGDSQVTATWNANTEADLAGYNVYLDGMLLTASLIKDTTYTITGLTNGKTYHVNISAVDKLGNKSLQAYKWPTPKMSSVVPSFPSGSVTVQPDPPVKEAPCVKAAKDEDLKNDQGKVDLPIDIDGKCIQFPANAAAITKDTVLKIGNDKLSAVIPNQVLTQLQNLVTADEWKNASIMFSYEKLGDEASQTAVQNAEKNLKNTSLHAAGDVYDLSLTITTADGKVQQLSRFDSPITLKLKVAEGFNSNLVGIYYLGDNGELSYIGGTYKDGYLTAPISHFSKYAVLEFKKVFADVGALHWAADAIAEMASEQVVTGISDSLFAPNKQVTRAEFAAFLVRKLNLTAEGTNSFTDASNGKWYADEVTAAAEAGIVTGRSQTSFAPEAPVTREEAVVMLVKANAILTGQKVDVIAAEASFADTQSISSCGNVT